MLKNRQKMERTSMNTSERDIDEKHDDIDDEFLSSTACSLSKSKDETSLSDNHLEISENSENLFSFNHKIPLGMIGRSSTSNSYITQVEQQPEQQQQPRSLVSVSGIHKNHLANIGRSFSEQNDDDDDEDDNSFVLNERSRSYSHVVGERPNSRNSNNSTNNVSSSLPTFFGHKSVPVSPIPQYKGAISREASFSESSRRRSLFRDSSVQSDSSHCSSVESLLESRKPDPEAILINLGFGPVHSEDVLSKIPKRFLKPSQVKGIDTESFLRQQQMANHLHDHSVLGYRGLVGNPDIPPSLIVAKIMERFELNERNRCIMDIHMNRPQSAPPTPGPNQ